MAPMSLNCSVIARTVKERFGGGQALRIIPWWNLKFSGARSNCSLTVQPEMIMMRVPVIPTTVLYHTQIPCCVHDSPHSVHSPHRIVAIAWVSKRAPENGLRSLPHATLRLLTREPSSLPFISFGSSIPLSFIPDTLTSLT